MKHRLTRSSPAQIKETTMFRSIIVEFNFEIYYLCSIGYFVWERVPVRYYTVDKEVVSFDTVTYNHIF